MNCFWSSEKMMNKIDRGQQPDLGTILKDTKVEKISEERKEFTSNIKYKVYGALVLLALGSLGGYFLAKSIDKMPPEETKQESTEYIENNIAVTVDPSTGISKGTYVTSEMME